MSKIKVMNDPATCEHLLTEYLPSAYKEGEVVVEVCEDCGIEIEREAEDRDYCE